MFVNPVRATPTTERCRHSCEGGLARRRSKGGPTNYLRPAERWAIQPRPGSESRLLLADCELMTSSWLSARRHIPSLSALAFVLWWKGPRWKWKCECPHATWGFFFNTIHCCLQNNIIFFLVHFGGFLDWILTSTNILARVFDVLWLNFTFFILEFIIYTQSWIYYACLYTCVDNF